MKIDLSDSPGELGMKAARQGAGEIRRAISARGEARIILATGASQFDVIAALVAAPDVAWSKVTVFHLDEYLDLPEAHKASFRGYLKTRFAAKIDDLGAFIFIEGDAEDTAGEVARVNKAIGLGDIDVAFIGIGENGHLAFNDPPADFDTKEPYIVVELDEQCRRQQANEGWFAELSEVPRRAISMSIQQILAAKTIICAVPDGRKAGAVQAALEGPVTNLCPASILQTHGQTRLYLDRQSAAKLDQGRLAAAMSGEAS